MYTCTLFYGMFNVCWVFVFQLLLRICWLFCPYCFRYVFHSKHICYNYLSTGVILFNRTFKKYLFSRCFGSSRIH